jgi:pimeloyl-ACP methyl ester carboxylesterase
MPSLPIILAHGYLGFGTLGPLSYFNNVAKILTQLGAQDVFATDVPPKGSISDRAAALAEQIRGHVPKGKVHVIAHSMGGLDARFLIGNRDGADLIATLTTLGSPFRGTFAADVASDPSKLQQVGVVRLLAAIARYEIGGLDLWPFAAPAQVHFAADQLRDAVGGIPAGDYSRVATYFSGLFSLDDSALSELTMENCVRLFRDDEKDLKGVPAFSYAGSIQPAAVSPLLGASAILLDAMGEPNDGLVPVSSATLQHHGADLPVDHLGLIGWGPTDVSAYYRAIYASLPVKSL